MILDFQQLDPLGDGISFVEIVTCMGDDYMVANSARVSFNKTVTQDENGNMRARDIKLINYLAQHGHWTPFAQPQIQFRIKMPMAIRTQWYKSTVGLLRNEVSRRYVHTMPEYYLPTEWRLAPEDKKQGSSDRLHWDKKEITKAVDYLTTDIDALYGSLINKGVAPEQARLILPGCTYTEFIETGSLYAYARIVGLRSQPDAQLEVQKYANAVSDLIRPLFPVAWEALRGQGKAR